MRLDMFEATLLAVVVVLNSSLPKPADDQELAYSAYFPPPESKGGWRKLDNRDEIRRQAGMDPNKLSELKDWLLKSDQRDFAAVVIRNGFIVLEVERGNSSRTDSRRVASVSKAICATVLAIASEESRQGRTPRKMTFEDPAFDFIPWAKPLSDPRKAKVTVKQLLNHTSGICPEATGARNEGPWKHVLGHDGDPLTAKLAFDPGTRCGYSTFALYHAALVCENVTGKPYDQFAIDALFRPVGCEHWSFEHFDGGGKDENRKYGRHASHSMGMPARDLARIAYCMLRDGRWEDKQVIPRWFVQETAAPTHDVNGPEMRFKRNAQSFSHGWELPARLTGEGGPSGLRIPKDARYKPGSGGQLIAFVPSLDLVITRQTGSSGEWEFEEYVRRAVAAVLAGEKTTPATKGKSFMPMEEYQALLKEYEETSRGFRNAKSDTERKKAVEDMSKFSGRFIELAEKHRNDPIALEALTQSVRIMNSVDSLTMTSWETNKTAFPEPRKDKSAEKVMELLLRDHIQNEKLGLVCERMRYGIRKEYETFLSKVLNASPHMNVQGLACLSLAEFLKIHLQKLDLIQERPEFAERYRELLGNEFYEELQRKGNAKLTKEIETLLEQAATKHAEVKMPYGGSVGEQARAELFEILHLTIGREALDIGGEDQNGKQFKLSDYRGKVVLLYFWSEY
jgi:CubicO group peptidase (beta-lactamase class C family)